VYPYVVSLARTSGRALRTLKSLREQDLKFRVFDAVDGLAQLDERMVSEYAGHKRSRRLQVTSKMTNKQLEQLYHTYSTSTLENDFLRQSLHERLRFACYMSHVSIWREIPRLGLPFMIVLEDDVQIVSQFLPKLMKVMDFLPANWDLLYLNGCYKIFGPVIGPGLRLARGGLCTFGYLISEHGARSLNRAIVKRDKPIDHVMDEEVLYGRILAFHADPPLIQQLPDIKSTLAY